MVPRGFGTMFAMMFAGRLPMKMDPAIPDGRRNGRCLLWSHVGDDGLDAGRHRLDISAVTFIQGLGMGLVFVPMNLVAFATLSPQLRTDGAGADQPDAQYRQRHRRFGDHHVSWPPARRPSMPSLSEGISPFNRALGVNAALHDAESR